MCLSIERFVGQPEKELQELEEWQDGDANVEWEIPSNLSKQVHGTKGNLLLHAVHVHGLIVDVQLKTQAKLNSSFAFIISS